MFIICCTYHLLFLFKVIEVAIIIMVITLIITIVEDFKDHEGIFDLHLVRFSRINYFRSVSSFMKILISYVKIQCF